MLQLYLQLINSCNRYEYTEYTLCLFYLLLCQSLLIIVLNIYSRHVVLVLLFFSPQFVCSILCRFIFKCNSNTGVLLLLLKICLGKGDNFNPNPTK